MTMQRDATGPEDGIGDNVARKQPFLALQGNLEGLTIRGLSPRASMLQHRDKVHVRLQVHPGPPGPSMGWALGQWASTVNSLPLGLGLGLVLVCGSGRDCDWAGLFDYRSIPHQRDRRVLVTLYRTHTAHLQPLAHPGAHTAAPDLRPKCSPSEVASVVRAVCELLPQAAFPVYGYGIAF